MTNPDLDRFFSWLDDALATPVPPGIAAFNVNIAQTLDAYVLDIVGSSRYDPEDPDWACEEDLAFREPPFEMPFAVHGSDWRIALETVVTMLSAYLGDASPTNPFKSAKAVTAGFVDGELELVWSAEPTL